MYPCPCITLITHTHTSRAITHRDRLYAEILKKKREMQRLIKEKEAAWAARQAAANPASGGGRRSFENQNASAAANANNSGRSHVPGHHSGHGAARRSGNGQH